MSAATSAHGGAPTRPAPAAPWHTLTADDAAERLGSAPGGLTADAAARRLREVGPNAVAAEPEARWLTLAAGQFRDPLIYILLGAAAVTLALRDVTDAVVILAVVVLNAAIGFAQETRARQAMRALATLSAPRAHVLRDGTEDEIPSRDLVPGDVVLLTSGSRVPADLRLVHARDLDVDESLLTGESVAVAKTIEPLADPGRVAADQANMAFSGTIVVRGRGRGLVVRTGAATELGRIAAAMRAVGDTATPMQEALARFGRRVGAAVVALAVVVLVVGLARGLPPAQIFLTAVALAVAAIPEGLPVVLTITLAVGVRRMARRRAIVRALPAVETLGSTTVIASDKTGTLTRNEMTVRTVWTGGARADVGSAVDAATVAGDAALRATLVGGVLASEADAAAAEAGHRAGDPIELALLAAAARAGLAPAELQRRHPELDLLPFESERQLMVSLRAGDGGAVEHLKGAPEAVLARCQRQLRGDGHETPIVRDAALAAAAELAAEGLRVLAIAYRPAAGRRIDERALDGGFVLAGLAGMEDPVRPEAVAAVADAHAAGIRVLMLTGDHAGTARAIAGQLGLGDAVLTGRDVAEMSDAALDAALGEVHAFARVTPEHKLRVVERLKAAGEVVAVTGDGVNDAPALRAAHLGIAMGASGSDVAREASDIVLADDNFATITAAVHEGRIVFGNVRKVTFFLLSTAVGEVLAVLVTLLAGWPLPFTAAQLLWINLVTDSIEVMALSFEPGEPGLLARPPRPRGEGVLTRQLLLRLGGVGLVLVCATRGVFWWTLRTTGDLATARTAALTEMVVLQFFHTFNCRSLDRSIFRIPLLSNRFLFVSMIGVTAAHLAALYVPVMRRVLRTVPLDAGQWLVILVVGLTVIVGGELDKLVNRAMGRRIG